MRISLFTCFLLVAVASVYVRIYQIEASTPQHYGKVSITTFERIDQDTVAISGTSDLPDGALLDIFYGPQKTKELDSTWASETYTYVSSGRFSTRLGFYGKHPACLNYKGPWNIRIFFSPDLTHNEDHNPSSVISLVGSSGENLVGPFLRTGVTRKGEHYRVIDAWFSRPLTARATAPTK